MVDIVNKNNKPYWQRIGEHGNFYILARYKDYKLVYHGAGKDTYCVTPEFNTIEELKEYIDKGGKHGRQH